MSNRRRRHRRRRGRLAQLSLHTELTKFATLSKSSRPESLCTKIQCGNTIDRAKQLKLQQIVRILMLKVKGKANLSTNNNEMRFVRPRLHSS